MVKTVEKIVVVVAELGVVSVMGSSVVVDSSVEDTVVSLVVVDGSVVAVVDVVTVDSSVVVGGVQVGHSPSPGSCQSEICISITKLSGLQTL